MRFFLLFLESSEGKRKELRLPCSKMATSFVTLKTGDEKIFKVEKSIMCASNLIRNILEDLEESQEAV
jgi:hypothetical protein